MGLKHIELFENFVSVKDKMKKFIEEEQRVKNRIPKKSDKIKMGDHIYKDKKHYRCIVSDGKGNTQIQEIIKGNEVGEIITLTDVEINKAKPLNSKDGEGNNYSWKINEAGTMYEPKRIIAYYEALCKSEGITPLPVKFERVAKCGASVTYNPKTLKALYMSFDINRMTDPEYAVIHELAHQIRIETDGDPSHSAKFKKLENKLNDKYMYSKFSELLWK